MLSVILIAGLEPFQSPTNGVDWLANANGVRFSRHGTILSSGAFQMAGTEHEASSSLEIWLQPDPTGYSGTILCFSTPRSLLQFSLLQYNSDLRLERQSQSREDRHVIAGVEGIFDRDKAVFITLTSGAQQSAVYVDGALVRTFPQFRLEKDFTGQLVVGTSTLQNDNWRGELRGLAIYHTELSPEQVAQNYHTWTRLGRPRPAETERAVALYLFREEQAGNVVHNVIIGSPNLYIPQRYMLLHQLFLEPFWQEYEPGWGHKKDILVNVVGFIPLGFVFFAYWSSIRPIQGAAFVTMALGFAISLMIEVLQSYLPTRNSGTTDLITNTLGTFLGVKLYGWRIIQSLLARIYEPMSSGPFSFGADTAPHRRDV